MNVVTSDGNYGMKLGLFIIIVIFTFELLNFSKF